METFRFKYKNVEKSQNFIDSALRVSYNDDDDLANECLFYNIPLNAGWFSLTDAFFLLFIFPI